MLEVSNTFFDLSIHFFVILSIYHFYVILSIYLSISHTRSQHVELYAVKRISKVPCVVSKLLAKK